MKHNQLQVAVNT